MVPASGKGTLEYGGGCGGEVGRGHVGALKKIRRPGVIHSDQAQNRRVHVVNGKRRFLGTQTEIVARSQHLPAVNARSRHPHAEYIWMMVAALGSLGQRS